MGMRRSPRKLPDDSLRAHCADSLATLEKNHLLRQMREVESAQGTEIKVADRPLLNFASNDYLGFAGHPALAAAAILSLPFPRPTPFPTGQPGWLCNAPRCWNNRL